MAGSISFLVPFLCYFFFVCWSNTVGHILTCVRSKQALSGVRVVR